MVRVCIVGVYFGKLPDYFDLWLKSAQRNPAVDFMIFTDQQRDALPKNVRFVGFTLEKMKKLASEKLGFAVNLERPYKCCDFKPAYGAIFEEYLKEYAYWGHCDFDLIWGDLSGFFEKYELEKYDKFLPLGHLSLYRNTHENNHRFMLEGAQDSYKTVFTNEGNYAFDEMCGVYRIFEKNGFPMFDQRVFADISAIYKRFRRTLTDKNYDYQVFCWEDGHVYRYYYDGEIKRDEFMYIHFQKRGLLPVESGCVDADAFYVTNQGFFTCSPADISIGAMQKYNFFDSHEKEKRELKSFMWKEKRKKITKKINRLLHRKEMLR